MKTLRELRNVLFVGGLAVSLLQASASTASEVSPSERAQGLQLVSADREGVTFRVESAHPALEIQPDGSWKISAPDLTTAEQRIGYPDLPTRTLLVAIPADAEPRLEVRWASEPVRWNGSPRAVARREVELDRDAVETLGSESLSDEQRVEIYRSGIEKAYAGRESRSFALRSFPEAPAWLGKTGVFRTQRYVEVHVAPVRHDGIRRGIEWTPAFEMRVHFDGAGTIGSQRAETGSSPFEVVYRNLFLNYSQGREFRLVAEVEPGGSEANATLGSPGLRARVLVTTDAPRRLDYARLQPLGFHLHPISTWRLTTRGEQVPLRVLDDGDDLLEPGEWVEFYGKCQDDEPKTVLSTDEPSPTPDIFEYRDFSDTNVYFLSVESGPQPAMSTRGAAPTLTRTPPSFFTETAHLEVDDAWRPLGGADPWYWAPATCATSNTGCPNTRSVTVPLTGLALSAPSARVRLQMRGLSPFSYQDDVDVDPDHLTRVRFRNSASVTLAADDEAWDGRIVFQHDFNWLFPGTGAGLTDPMTVDLEMLPITPSRPNDVMLDFIEIDYPRTFTANGDQLIFEWPDEDAEFVVSGLVDPAPEVWEITLPAGEIAIRAIRLTGGTVSGSGPYSVRFRVDQDPLIPDGSSRRFAVFGGAGTTLIGPAEIAADTISDLKNSAQQADMIVIAHPAVLDAAPGACVGANPTGCLSELLAFRATPAGGGLTSKIVRLDDIEDEFNDGLSGPAAIREFLRWVLSTTPGEGWQDPRPAYVMLVGDGSYRYKDGTSMGNFVPTQILFKDALQLGYYASDNMLGAVVGNDPIPDLVIGRVPARSTADANAMLQKILNYEQSPTLGSWRSHALFVSDRGKTGNNPAEALQFEGLNATAEALMQRPPYTSRHLRYWSDYYDDNPTPAATNAMRDDLKDAVNGVGGIADGAAIVQFMGHGSFTVWSDDAFFDERFAPYDSDDLINANRLPWLLAHNCLTGGFHIDSSSTMAENWFRRQGGGAVATFSPSGLSFNFIGDTVINVIWDDLFGRTKERHLAVPVLDTTATLCAQGSVESCQHYILLGDPATNLALKSVGPPTQLDATGGNAQVQISWTASSTASAMYDIYRASSVSGPAPQYSKINPSPVANTSFVDTSVVNARDYFYYVIARDTAGFVSAWSNLNTGCTPGSPETSGPDCLHARPLNPNSPVAPSGISVFDPGVGNQLRVSWTPNPENDIEFYTVHFGTQPGVYANAVLSSGGNSLVLQQLIAGETYFIAVTATNTSARTSGFSGEVSDFPVLAPGLRPPAFVSDLKVRSVGNDLVLEWTPVSLDAYGKPTTIVSYEILRGSGPPFVNSGLAVLATCSGAACASWTDTGARSAPNNWYYRIRAVDSVGNRGALGSEAPSGTLSLRISPSIPIPGNVVLSWNPVTTRLDGGALDLQHYEVYQSATPFSPAAVRDGVIPVWTTVTGTTLDVTPAASTRYYSVFAVDIRGNRSPY